MVYLVSGGVLVLATFLCLSLSGMGVLITVDIPSILVVFFACIFVLVASNSVRHFFRGLFMVVSKKSAPPIETAYSFVAVSLVIRALLFLSALFATVSLFLFLVMQDQLARIGPVLALGICTLLYAGEISFMLVPVRAILKKRIVPMQVGGNLEPYEFSKIPAKPYLVIAIGIPVLVIFAIFAVGASSVTFFEEFWGNILWMEMFVILSPYIILIPSGQLGAYFHAIMIGFRRKDKSSSDVLLKSHGALETVLYLRCLLAISGAALLIIIALGSLESRDDIPRKFSAPLLLLMVSFINTLFLLPLIARVEKLIAYRTYGQVNG